jgi:hypothetical protein
LDSGDWQLASAGDRLLLTGDFTQTIDADPGSGSLILNAGSKGYAFVGEYSKAGGSLVWAQSYGNASSNATAGVQPLVDPATGNLYIGGAFDGTVNFNPAAPGGTLVSAGEQDGFLLKLDAGGNYLNAWRMGGTGYDYAARPIGLLGSTIYSAGGFSTTADFPTGGTLTSRGLEDVFLMALDQSAQIGSFAAAMFGSDVTLTAANVTDPNAGGTITQVAFYVDSNGNGILESSTDTLLGYGTKNSDGTWTRTLSHDRLGDRHVHPVCPGRRQLQRLQRPAGPRPPGPVISGRRIARTPPRPSLWRPITPTRRTSPICRRRHDAHAGSGACRGVSVPGGS